MTFASVMRREIEDRLIKWIYPLTLESMVYVLFSGEGRNVLWNFGEKSEWSITVGLLLYSCLLLPSMVKLEWICTSQRFIVCPFSDVGGEVNIMRSGLSYIMGISY